MDLIFSLILLKIYFFINYRERWIFSGEDFNFKNYNNLNDANNEEIFIDEIFKNISRKKYFKSKILSKDKQKYLFELIENIYIYKGNSKDSDIAFLKIK